jgi:hypothetical protein
VLPTLWFRNIWAWWPEELKPSLTDASKGNGASTIAASNALLGDYFLHCQGSARLLFTENETNNQRLFGSANPTPYFKDGINDYVVAGGQSAVNPNNTGTKAAAYYQLRVGAKATVVIRLRLTNVAAGSEDPFGARFTQILDARRREADEFYRSITPLGVGEDAANVMRQALAGMLWSKQYFFPGSFCATRPVGARSLVGPRNFRAIPIGGIIYCSTNIFTATTARRQSSNRLDWGGGIADRNFRAPRRAELSRTRARGRL